MISDKPIVFVVDDDERLRRALERMLQLHGYKVVCFASAEEFLKEPINGQVCCLLLDQQLSGLSGLELQNFLLREENFVPIIFISGHGTIPVAIRAIKSGAVTFLTKPFSEKELLDEIERALALCRKEIGERSNLELIRRYFESLTPRESQIFECVVNGKLNKQTAGDLGIVLTTVKVHRRRVMKKMHAESLADLVVMAQKLRLSDEKVQKVTRQLCFPNPPAGMAQPGASHLPAVQGPPQSSAGTAAA